MAFRIVRQPKKITLIGAPSAAGAHHAGTEAAPQALRAAGLAQRLTAAGFEVTDLGDIPPHPYATDEGSPRARNIGAVVAACQALKPLVETAVKSGALPLVLGGDCTISLGVIAGVRRYHPHVCLMYCDGDADLNTPATTPSGCLDGMVVAHAVGKGSPELVRISADTPLVREPDVALFGVTRLDPGEEKFLAGSPMRKYSADDVRRLGAAAAARQALVRIHTGSKQLVLHFDGDVIASSDMGGAAFASADGLRLTEMRDALAVFVQQQALAAILVTEYEPAKDADGAAARALVELLASALATRLAGDAASAADVVPAPAVSAPASPDPIATAATVTQPVEPAAAQESPEVAGHADALTSPTSSEPTE